MLQRRFLIASSFARLIRKERGVAGRVVEGYLLARSDRDHFVSIETEGAYLVLRAKTGRTRIEERTEIPRSQAEALLEICAGRIGFERTGLGFSGARAAFLDHFIAPGPLDCLTFEFDDGENPDSFAAPDWFGPDVTADPAYENGSFALNGMPESPEAALSDTALDTLLNYLENRHEASYPTRDRQAVAASTEVAAEAGAQRAAAPLDTVLAGVKEALENPTAPSVATESESKVVVQIERADGRGRRP